MKYPTLFALFLALSFTHLVPCLGQEGEGEDSEIPINQRATAAAWVALRAGDNQKAIEKANECIVRFQKPADTVQSILEQQKTVLPTGNVSNEERARIDRFQILHDVATCLLIRAWAEESLGLQKQATSDYAEVRKYTYARTSEKPGEPLWSTAEVAVQNLQRLSP